MLFILCAKREFVSVTIFCVCVCVCSDFAAAIMVRAAATDTAMIPVFLPASSGVQASSLELLSPDDVAEIVVWLLSEEARLISGVNLPIGFRA